MTWNGTLDSDNRKDRVIERDDCTTTYMYHYLTRGIFDPLSVVCWALPRRYTPPGDTTTRQPQLVSVSTSVLLHV